MYTFYLCHVVTVVYNEAVFSTSRTFNSVSSFECVVAHVISF